MTIIDNSKAILNKKNIIIGCVAENTPKYLSQALRLIQSIRWFGGSLATAKIVVCVVDGVSTNYRDTFEKYSTDVRIVTRFSKKHPPSNKLRFLQQSDLDNYKYVLLLDCDTIVIQDPSEYLQHGVFKAKIADAPTVSAHVLRKLFDFFELPFPSENHKCTVTGTPTISYFNAGVLLFSQTCMSNLVPAWIKFNEILISRIDLLESSANFCEQASLSLALTSTGQKYETLGNEMNFPTHLEHYQESHLLQHIDPYIIHYHSCVNILGYIKRSKYPLVNKRIIEFNNRLCHERSKFSFNTLCYKLLGNKQ
jgi:hypothetical protein